MPAGGPEPIGAIVGSTASGKSELAMAVAQSLGDVELVSIDAMQVYRGMDIGTAKPTPAESAAVRHHLVDLVDPHQEMTLARFQEAYAQALADILERGKRALLVGGTGLYARAVIDDLDIPGQFPEARDKLDADPDTGGLHDRLAHLDPAAAGRIEPTNRRRILRALEVTIGSGKAFSSYGPGLTSYRSLDFPVVGLRLERPLLDQRIGDRLGRQMEAGFLDEVAGLVAREGGLSRTARQALGYRELLAHLEDGVPLGDALAEAEIRTRRFARRQERWFRRDPRIVWVDVGDEPLDALSEALVVLGEGPNRMAGPVGGLRD